MKHGMTRTTEATSGSLRHAGGGGGGAEEGGRRGGCSLAASTTSLPSSSSSPMVSRATMMFSPISPPPSTSPISPPPSFSPILPPPSYPSSPPSSYLLTESTQGLTSSFNQSYTTLVRLGLQARGEDDEVTEGGANEGKVCSVEGAVGGKELYRDDTRQNHVLSNISVENGGMPACSIGETQEILVQSIHHVTKTTYSTWSDVELCIREENDPPAPLALPSLTSTPAGPQSLPQLPHRRARWDKSALAGHRRNGLVLAELARDCEDSEWDQTNRSDWNEVGQNETDLDETGQNETDWGETDLDEATGLNETDLGETDLGETDYNNETDIGETDYNNETDLGETDYNNETDLGGETDNNEGDQTEENGSQTKEKTKDEEERTTAAQTKTQIKTNESTNRGTKHRTAMNRQGDTVRLSHGEIELERPVKQKVKRTASSRSRRVGYGDAEMEATAKDISQSQNEAELTGHLREKDRALRELAIMRSRLANLRKIIHGKNEEIKLLKARLKEEVMGEAAAVREKATVTQNSPRGGGCVWSSTHGQPTHPANMEH
ncbi:uncharacterized protein LOC135113158 [Scylla paramamosain]|uniref:uncharacterized protein LOC135113158 n=1 Tax=Scylla paramamosain TaxID=85552 RepID=UPI0030836201